MNGIKNIKGIYFDIGRNSAKKVFIGLGHNKLECLPFFYLNPTLLFLGNARSLPLEWSLVRRSILVGSRRGPHILDLDGSGKHSSLSRYGNNYLRQKCYITGLW